jgi:hypothetical protein
MKFRGLLQSAPICFRAKYIHACVGYSAGVQHDLSGSVNVTSITSAPTPTTRPS